MEGQLLRVVQGTNLVWETVDSWVWKNDKISGYLVKSAYSILRGPLEEESSPLFEYLWKIALLLVQFTTWRVLVNSIASKDNLERRGVAIASNLCCFCGGGSGDNKASIFLL